MIDKMIDVSVVIPVYNAALLIDRCLDSVFSQSQDLLIEVILVDDGSSDNSVALIEKRQEKNIILIKRSNSGPAAARNVGINQAKGKYLAFIDADDYWLPGFINKTVDFLNSHSDCIAVSVVQRHITISGESISPRYIGEIGSQTNPFIVDNFYAFWAKYNHVCTGSIMMLTQIVKETKGQREELRICEDLEFWAYLATFGKFGFIPEILFVSDGVRVTEEIGWVEKNRKRWASAPTVENWEERISLRFGGHISEGYIRSRGKIARNLCYSILMSKRYDLAYKQIRSYQSEFPDGLMTKVLRLGVINKLMWLIVSRVLIYREYNR